MDLSQLELALVETGQPAALVSLLANAVTAPEGPGRCDQRVPPGRLSDSANPQARPVVAV